ncbi:hypothetical protein ANCDUO_05753 [Ancylostoma duodenale]|uniref:Uncharacterized protein n=1 Tax=Ancylostoma duodenale TaxID=51022 RepID=A0A0C2D3D1_9BILA|nr:hypothetical protein ANCDUO_05753 [Ancylostoma duodenale]
MFMTKFVLTRTPTPPTPLLSQVPRNSSSSVSKVAFSSRCLLVSVSPMTSYLIFAAAHAKLSKIRCAGHVMRLNDNRWTRAVCDWTHGTLSSQQEDYRPKGQTSSRSPSRNDTMLFVSLEGTEFIGRLWHARGANGRIAGAHSVYPKIDGSQGDQGGQGEPYAYGGLVTIRSISMALYLGRRTAALCGLGF